MALSAEKEENMETILSVHRNRTFRYCIALFKSLL